VEYFNDILCVEASWLIAEGIISNDNYKQLKSRGVISQARRACKGTTALVTYDSIPERFKSLIIEKVGDPYKNVKKYGFRDQITPDAKAMEYYSSYQLDDGKTLPDDNIREYTTNAQVLNAIHTVVSNRIAKRRSLGGSKSGLWESMAKQVEEVREEVGHTLPSNLRRLKDKYKKYLEEGYDVLIHKGFSNTNRRKVNESLEGLLLSMYTMKNKPYMKSVHELYLQFLAGDLEVVNTDTGELYDRNDFYKDGQPLMISEGTVWNVLKNPKNVAIAEKVRAGSLEFSSTHRPHHHRHAPVYSLSKISMDDRDLPRKMKNGKRVKAYYAYDVASRTLIGASYSMDKDATLFIGCMRDMFRNLHTWGLGTPMEVEVEHHLVNLFKDDLMDPGNVFPFVRWCNPGNSQEKYAEVMNKDKKYGFEKRYQDGIGRFYAKLGANRPKVDKISDKDNNNYNDKKYEYEELIADDLYTIEKFNNSLHPDQNKYKGKTRLDVLKENANPHSVKLNESVLARYIGDSTSTSIRRSQYVRVQYANYQLPSPRVLAMLAPNNLKVEAFYLPEEDGQINKVYLYQNGQFIAECSKIKTYNTATAEQTDADTEAYTNQAKYVSEFDAMVKKAKPDKAMIIESTTEPIEDFEEAEIIDDDLEDIINEFENESSDFDFDNETDDYWAQKAMNDL